MGELSNQVFNNFAVYVGEAIPSSKVLVDEFFVIDTHQVHDGSLEIMDVNRIFGDVVAEVICLAIDHPGLHTAPCHEYGECSRMMVSAIILR